MRVVHPIELKLYEKDVGFLQQYRILFYHQFFACYIMYTSKERIVIKVFIHL
jgi:hypothetical protein